MYVERWQDFSALLDDIYPMLKPLHKAQAVSIKVWAKANQNRHDGLLPVNIKAAIKAFNNVIPYLPDEWVTRCEHAIAFLQAINNQLNINWIETEKGCLFWDYYWWDNDCHTGLKPPPPEPPEPPPVLRCSDYTNQTACLGAGCYWWENACHDQVQPPPRVLKCSEHTTLINCVEAGCYWWDNTCHDQVQPPVTVLACSDYKTETKCLTEGCYWYDGSCHDQPKVPPVGPTDPLKELAKQLADYCSTIPITKVLQKASCVALTVTLKVLSNFFDWQRKS